METVTIDSLDTHLRLYITDQESILSTWAPKYSFFYIIHAFQLEVIPLDAVDKIRYQKVFIG